MSDLRADAADETDVEPLLDEAKLAELGKWFGAAVTCLVALSNLAAARRS